MKAFKFSLLLASLIYLPITYAAEPIKTPHSDDNINAINLIEQRQIYQKLTELTQASPSESSSKLIQQLLNKLESYPLYPDAQYRWFKSNIAQLDFEHILAYQQRYPKLSFATELKRLWLKQQQQQQNWQGILQQKIELPEDLTSQCIILQAEFEDAKTQQKNTALLQQRIKDKLWLQPKALPKDCDSLIQQWHQQGLLSPQLAKQRAILLLTQNDQRELQALQQRLTDKANQQWVADLIQLQKSPQKLIDASNPFYIEQLSTEDPLNQQLINIMVPAYINSLPTNQPIAIAQQLQQWANRWQIGDTQLQLWLQKYVAHFFDDENAEFSQWRDQQLIQWKDDKLTERRIRLAIRQRTDKQIWLQQLSFEAQQKEEWQYWLAQYAPEAQRKSILQKLSKARHFYAMLAAEELGESYQPNYDQLGDLKPTIASPTKDANVKKSQIQTQAKKADERNSAQIEKTFSSQLARINELFYWQAQAEINNSWAALLNQANFEQKLRLADYALQQHWYDLAVEATIQAKAWSYLPLRLPNAYPQWFDLYFPQSKIQRTFAMAIARQESAWKAYVRSPANARGLMQLLPETARQTAQQANLPYNNEQQLLDPFYNIMLGVTHLNQLYDKYGNNRILIAAAYNAGPHRVDKWLAQSQGKLSLAEFVSAIPFYETRGYVQNVLAYDSYYQILLNQQRELFSQEEKNRLY